MVKQYLEQNLKEILIGLAVGLIISLLADISIKQAITLLILGPTVALVLNELLKTFVRNENNKRTAFIILFLIGGFFFLQEYNIGTFSVANIDVPVEDQSIFKKPTSTLVGGLLGAGKGGLVSTLAGVVGIAFFVNPIVGIIVLALFLLFFGVPFLGLAFSIFQNFQLVLVMVGLIALAFMVFKTKQIRSLSQRG